MMTSPCTRCAPTITICIIKQYKLSVWRVFTGLGGAGEEVCPNESAIERFRSRIKEMNHTKNRKKRYQRGILAYVVMADGLVRWGSLNTTLKVINCVHWLSSDLCLMVNEKNSKRNKLVLQIQTPGRQKLHEARKMHFAKQKEH